MYGNSRHKGLCEAQDGRAPQVPLRTRDGDFFEVAHKAHEVNALNYLTVILGFGLCRAWIVFCLTASLVLGSNTKSGWLFLITGALSALFVTFIVRALHNSVGRMQKPLYRVCGALLLFAAILIPFAVTKNFEALTLIGFAVGGAGAGLLQVLWGEQFALHRIRFATIVSPAAAIVTALFVALSVAGLNLIGYLLFPLASFGLLTYQADCFGLKTKCFLPLGKATKELLCNTVTQESKSASGIREEKSNSAQPKEKPREHFEKRPVGFAIGKLMFSIMTFSFLCRVFDILPHNGPNIFGLFGGSALFSLIVVGAAFLLLTTILKQRFNPTFTYRLSLPIMVAGFAAIAFFFDTHGALCILLINIGYEFFDILSWILFTETARRKGELPLRIFGLGVAFMFTGMALGYLVGDAVQALIVSGRLQITVVAMLSILSLVVVAFLVVPEGTIMQLMSVVCHDKKETVVSKEVDSHSQKLGSFESQLQKNCVAAAKAYHLTPREKEVFELLTYGRTLSIIARDLQIAQGTARSHMESIYRKLAVHKQQELIDLVMRFQP